MASIEETLGGKLGDLKRLSDAARAQTAGDAASRFVGQYGPIHQQLTALVDAIEVSNPKMLHVFGDVRKYFDPLEGDPLRGLIDLDDLEVVGFIDALGRGLSDLLGGSYLALNALEQAYESGVRETLECGTATPTYTVQRAGDQMPVILQAAMKEYSETVLGYEKSISGLYLLVRKQYKKLRRKYLGDVSGKEPEKDDMEDQILSHFFGNRPKQPEKGLGPAIALVDDNAFLTEALMGISKSLPKRYEKTVPVLRNGKVTSNTKTVKYLDDDEVETAAQSLLLFATSGYLQTVRQPNEILEKAASVVARFASIYSQVEPKLREFLKACVKYGFIRLQSDMKLDQKLPDPAIIVRHMRKVNFSNIRPIKEEIAPRTKVEKDYGNARMNLLKFLLDAVAQLEGMDRDDEKTLEFATLKVKEAIKLRDTMDDVTRTEREKRLKKDIEGENEFYVGKGGQLGSLEIEREPAPKITYSDVAGASFIKAKENVDEVVKVASHGHTMRLSAPRGDVRSNLLLIGPYGCGKSEMAKAVGADPRIIGLVVSAADLLTAYMHESVKNIKRMYEHAKDLRRQSRYTKPVGIILDEFDRLFSYGEGVHAAYDGKRMEGVLQETMDGVVGYEGVFILALTNVPNGVPQPILRRFKYVDVVGQLTKDERAELFRKFLVRGLPISDGVTQEDYLRWAEQMVDAPGDVLGKVADEVHFKFVRELTDNHPSKIAGIERSLARRLREREANAKDYEFTRKALGSYREIGAVEITNALDSVLHQPQVQMQIDAARQVYRDAEDVLKGLAVAKSVTGLGFTGDVARKSKVWTREA